MANGGNDLKGYKLKWERLTRREAHDLIIDQAKYAANGLRNGLFPAFGSDNEVKKFFLFNGLDFDEEVEKAREFNYIISMVENFLGTVWETMGTAKVGIGVAETGEVYEKPKGPGTLVWKNYENSFENAVRDFLNAIELLSFPEYCDALANGIAAIEGYINYKAEYWNRVNTINRLEDSRAAPVSFEEKIDNWIPIMNNGKKFEKSNRIWRDFKILRKYRDDYDAHLKKFAYVLEYKEFVEILNMFKTGIARFLFELHILFKERIPSIIIRYSFTPEIFVVEYDDNISKSP